MEYITSRSFSLPSTIAEMEASDWYNMWNKAYFPYNELLVGDIIYWYDTKKKMIIWKTVVSEVAKLKYSDKHKIPFLNNNKLDGKYFESRPNNGYFVGYRVNVLMHLTINKPEGFQFPRLGWIRIDNDTLSNWFRNDALEDENTIDEIMIKNNMYSNQKVLSQINDEMKNKTPEQVTRIINTTLRKDTKIVQALKKAAGYQCQFPSCGHRIKKKDGGYYIEVAHIKPVSKNGQSVLGNLIVLCPNHHKEFDYGEKTIDHQSLTYLSGELNGKPFEIDLSIFDSI